MEPAIVEAKHDNELVRSELFVPILTVETFKTLDEAIGLANDTEFGLTAGFYSKKKSEVKEFIGRIEAGVVYANREASATTGAMVGTHTFVGWKASGFSGKGYRKQVLPPAVHEGAERIRDGIGVGPILRFLYGLQKYQTRKISNKWQELLRDNGRHLDEEGDRPMFRKRLPKGLVHALHIRTTPDTTAYGCRNMRFPIDAVWLDQRGVVVDEERI